MSISTTRSRANDARRTARKDGKKAFVLPRKLDPCRDLRPANDNAERAASVIERTAMWLVPVLAFALFALVVISAT